ncbi:MAG: GNAT family N-acetyltransferase [Thermodesulfovibrionales bacterium]|nr:GNAT family N-acetyltransferase [Thermodesulfovibrionales bacterium]
MLFLRIPGCMEDGNLRLRPLRISDGPFILRRLNDRAILKANGLSRPIASSWFFVWWWMKKTFTPSYFIECDSKQIGFIGLYNLIPGKSAGMGLIIFDKNNRRLGYGTRAFNICAQGMQRNSVVKEIIVKVKTDNHGALSFWRKLGFVEAGIINDLITMSMGLQRRI